MRRSWTILMDEREKLPLIFPATITMLNHSARPNRRLPIKVAITVERTCLRTGDYLLKEAPTRIIIERKGHLGEIATNCLTEQGRRRFVNECGRLRDECVHPILLIEGTHAQLIREWTAEESPWIAIDAVQRLCLEHGIEIITLPSTAMNHKRSTGEYVAHLLVNGALSCLPPLNRPIDTPHPFPRDPAPQSTSPPRAVPSS